MNDTPIQYLELPARNLDAAREFFAAAFGWTFTPYGSDYLAFHNAGVEGGFYRADMASDAATGAALIVFYSQNLSASQDKITAAGGRILKPTFSFPGGRRFHFCDPNDNEFAVWSEQPL